MLRNTNWNSSRGRPDRYRSSSEQNKSTFCFEILVKTSATEIHKIPIFLKLISLTINCCRCESFRKHSLEEQSRCSTTEPPTLECRRGPCVTVPTVKIERHKISAINLATLTSPQVTEKSSFVVFSDAAYPRETDDSKISRSSGKYHGRSLVGDGRGL
ncbi:hypothetical protein JTE90_015773 [Oedothorax gibbosus]|uniref:Uncharacterized protein n=1 Tax=Oedothorax gibbosus TaxID=931172 RepID=A0AAV6VYQ8_9ARAC|nr:hypothetical protein JTE90_015773 [Oedothorax gibbosus]